MTAKPWVIGGTSGIGKATALLIAQMGIEVQATGLGPDDRKVDVRSVDQLFDFIKAEGPFTHVVYSAGINYLEWIKDMQKTLLGQHVMETNWWGFVNVLTMLVNNNHDQPCRVVAVSSDAADRPMRTSLAYCSSKAALNMAVQVAARELGPAGWRINAVAPGMTDGTGMQRYIDEEVPRIRNWPPAKARSYEESQNPLGRRATVDEVAEVVRDVLFGPDYLNGSIVTINGGR